MGTDAEHSKRMRRAVELAERGRGLVAPNPMVGAVLVRGDDVVGEGWHAGPGTAHAERAALEAAGERARGATLYVTLEPCDHQGRTPPCTEAIVAAGVARVVAAADDPNPVVDGRGFARLRACGIRVQRGVLRSEAERQNEAFLRWIRTGRPVVWLKLAATLDGRTAASDGSSRWITGAAARADAHRLRASADAIVVGAGTALTDDPHLTVRDVPYEGEPPLRVVADAKGRVPASGALFDGSAPTLVATTDRAPAARRAEWAEAGAEVVLLDESERGVSLDSLMTDLGKREVQSVLIEGGSSLAWSALAGDLVDHVVFYLAPTLLGGSEAPGLIGGEGFAPVARARSVEIVSVGRCGQDLKVVADVHRDR